MIVKSERGMVVKKAISIIMTCVFLFTLTACGCEPIDKFANVTIHNMKSDECKISETNHTRYFTDKAEELMDSDTIRKSFDRYFGLVEISDRIDETSICANFDVYDYADFTLEVLTFVCKTKESPNYCVYTLATIQPEKELNNFKISHSSQDENAQLVSFFPYPGPYENIASVYNDYIGPFCFSDSLISTGEIEENPNSIYWAYEWENSNKDKYYWENASGVIDAAPQRTFSSLSVYTAESDSMVCKVESSFVMDDTEHKCEIDFSYLNDGQDSLFTLR